MKALNLRNLFAGMFVKSLFRNIVLKVLLLKYNCSVGVSVEKKKIKIKKAQGGNLKKEKGKEKTA